MVDFSADSRWAWLTRLQLDRVTYGWICLWSEWFTFGSTWQPRHSRHNSRLGEWFRLWLAIVLQIYSLWFFFCWRFFSNLKKTKFRKYFSWWSFVCFGWLNPILQLGRYSSPRCHFPHISVMAIRMRPPELNPNLILVVDPVFGNVELEFEILKYTLLGRSRYHFRIIQIWQVYWYHPSPTLPNLYPKMRLFVNLR